MRVGKLRMNAVAALSCVLGAGIALGFSGVLAAPANTPQARADAAFKAAGLSDVKLAPAIINLVVKGSMQQWDPGESESVSDPAKPATLSVGAQARRIDNRCMDHR